MMRTRLTMLAALTAAVAAMGCTGQGEEPPGQAGQSTAGDTTVTTAAAGTTAPTATTAPTGTTMMRRTTPSTDPPGSIHVSGTVYEGVEPGCLLLDASQSQPYLLLDGDPAVLRPGARVEVVGMPMDNIMSTCQQGRPLSVISATRV